MNTTMSRIATVLICLTLGTVAEAGGRYLGAAVGQNSFVDNDTDFDQNTTGYKVYVGRQFFKFFAAEAYYIDFGEAEQIVQSAGNEVKRHFNASGFGASALGILPIHRRLSFFGKIGLLFSEAEATTTLNDVEIDTAEDDGSELLFGLGATLNLNPHLALRGEWESVALDTIDSELASVAIQLDF